MTKFGIEINGKYITRACFGDFPEYHETPDHERKSYIIVEDVAVNPFTTKLVVKYKIVYEGNKDPNAIFTDTISEFKNIFRKPRY